MANMTFKTSLLPNTNLGYSLGSETQNWKIYGTINSNATLSGDNFAVALQTYFNNNKTNIARNSLLTYYSSAYGNGTQLFGYFLTGYNDSPYGGFFAAHYNTPKYIGIQNGTYTEQTILTNTNYSTTLDGRYVNITGDTMTGLLKITTNGNTLTLGSQNGTYCHFSSSLPYYLNNTTWIDGHLYPYGNNYVKNFGTTDHGWNNAYIRAISTRHLDALPSATQSDSSLYIGYGEIQPTKAIRMYYSTNTSSRTEFFQVNSNGSYALTRFGVNGQNTSYNLYVNGSSYLNGQILQGSNAQIQQKTNTTLGTAPSSNQYLSGLHWIDNNNVDYGYIRGTHFTNQNAGLQIEARRQVSGTWKYNSINLQVDTSGNAVVGIAGTNAAASWRAALGLGSNATSSTAYLPLAGGAMTGAIQYNGRGNNSIYNGPNDQAATYNGTLNNFVISSWYGVSFTTSCTGQTCTGKSAVSINCRNGYVYTGRTYGAVWNDYAEYRKDNPIEKEKQEPGRCAREIGDGTLALTTKRLERGCEIISDTFGFAIGQDEENGYNTPIASSGRVLAYPYESIEEFKKHIGYCVCSGPNGTVSIMTEEEEEKYPGRIIGTISEVPTYEEWGTGKVKVNGRVWIRIR